MSILRLSLSPLPATQEPATRIKSQQLYFPSLWESTRRFRAYADKYRITQYRIESARSVSVTL